MKREWYFFVLLTMMVNLVNGDPEFSSIQPARCRKRDTDLLLNGLSWTECLKSCRERPKCLAVSYKRSFHLCVLNYGGHNNLFNKKDPEVCIGFMYAEKRFWNTEERNCSCDGVQACTENGAGDVCPVKECQRHNTLPNGQIHGNLFAIGSKLKVSCNTDFTLIGAVQYVCNEDGQWVNATRHIPDEPVCLREVCPGGWTRAGSSCFYKSQFSYNFEKCKALCAAIAGKVLTIGSDEDKADVQTFVESITDTGDFWLGIVANTSDVADRRWYTIDSGNVVTFFDWNPGEPNGHHKTLPENCAIVVVGPGLHWHDVHCDRTLGCICQM